MEVNQDVLEKLICSICKAPLSVGPVFLQKDGQGSMCGRCSVVRFRIEVSVRNMPYEYLAAHVIFPCQNAKHGCTVKCVYGKAQENHEQECEFRQYHCGKIFSSICSWCGSKQEFLQHCKDKHPKHVVENPATFEYDIKSSVANYLMTAFQMLFLIHTEVFAKSKQIYHCVRLLGHGGQLGNFNYYVVSSNEDNRVIMKGVVAKQGCLAMKEEDSLAIGIHNLLGVFTNFKGTTFTLIVNSLIEKTEPEMNGNELYCCECGTNVIYRTAHVDESKWFCSACMHNKYACSFNRCSFMETKHKINIHKILYCTSNFRCRVCSKILGVSLENHYQNSHTNITYLCGEIFMTQFNRTEPQMLFITSDFGRLYCEHGFRSGESEYYINVCSAIDSGHLRWYTCEVQLHNPETELTLRKFLPLYDNKACEICDWQLQMTNEEIMQYVHNGEFKMAVTITKTK